LDEWDALGNHGRPGRLVVLAELRQRAGLYEGRQVVLVETPTGLLLLTREQLRELVRVGLTGTNLVDQLLADRRVAATAARNARHPHPFAKVEDEILSIIREPAIEGNSGEPNTHQ